MMHPDALKAIRTHYRNLLAKIVIKDRVPNLHELWLDVRKFSDLVLKQTNEWLNFSDLIEIMVFPLLTTTSSIDPGNPKLSGQLLGLIGDAAAAKLEEETIQFLQSLPRSYEFHFTLPRAKGFDFAEIKISENVSLCEAAGENHDSLAENGSSGPSISAAILLHEFFQQPTTTIPKGGVTARIFSRGYARGDFNSSASRSAFSALKQLIALGIAYDLFSLEAATAPSMLGSPTPKAIFRELSTKSGERMAMNLPHAAASVVNRIAINPEALKGDFTFIKKLFDFPDSDETVERIMTASEWAFESLSSENETVAFIQISIALEAVLGEGLGMEGITKGLADRCAYLLGRNVNDRKEIRDNFVKFYDIRSKLVHGRKPRLAPEEDEYLEWGRRTLNRILKRELYFL